MKTKTIVQRSIDKVFPFIEQFEPDEIVAITINPYSKKLNVNIQLEPDAFKKAFKGRKYQQDGEHLTKHINKAICVRAC